MLSSRSGDAILDARSRVMSGKKNVLRKKDRSQAAWQVPGKVGHAGPKLKAIPFLGVVGIPADELIVSDEAWERMRDRERRRIARESAEVSSSLRSSATPSRAGAEGTGHRRTRSTATTGTARSFRSTGGERPASLSVSRRSVPVDHRAEVSEAEHYGSDGYIDFRQTIPMRSNDKHSVLWGGSYSQRSASPSPPSRSGAASNHSASPARSETSHSSRRGRDRGRGIHQVLFETGDKAKETTPPEVPTTPLDSKNGAGQEISESAANAGAGILFGHSVLSSELHAASSDEDESEAEEPDVEPLRNFPRPPADTAEASPPSPTLTSSPKSTSSRSSWWGLPTSLWSSGGGTPKDAATNTPTPEQPTGLPSPIEEKEEPVFAEEDSQAAVEPVAAVERRSSRRSKKSRQSRSGSRRSERRSSKASHRSASAEPEGDSYATAENVEESVLFGGGGAAKATEDETEVPAGRGKENERPVSRASKRSKASRKSTASRTSSKARKDRREAVVNENDISAALATQLRSSRPPLTATGSRFVENFDGKPQRKSFAKRLSGLIPGSKKTTGDTTTPKSGNVLRNILRRSKA